MINEGCGESENSNVLYMCLIVDLECFTSKLEQLFLR